MTDLACLVRGSGQPLMLIHGAAGRPESAFPHLDELARDHTLIAPYLPDCVPSHAVGAEAADAWLTAVEAFLLHSEDGTSEPPIEFSFQRLGPDGLVASPSGGI